MSGPASLGLQRKVGFLCCGALGFALYYGLALALGRWQAIQPEVAALAAVLLSVPPVFLLHKYVAFRHRGDTLPSFAKYCLLQAFNAIAIGALVRLGRQLGLPHAINIAAAGAAVVVISYVVLSRGIFRVKESS